MSTLSPLFSSPKLGEPAPYFEAPSTHGQVRLTDYLGRWLVFFSHPADFSPVCSHEIVDFARRRHEFEALHCSLVGVSRDSVETHEAWLRTIEQQHGVTVAFPVLSDPSLAISHRYAMAPAEGSDRGGLRALFVIDPAGKLRASLHYPRGTGRPVEEVLKLLPGLQVGGTPAAVAAGGTRPDAPTRSPSRLTMIAREEPRELNYGCVDWFCYSGPPSATREATSGHGERH